MGNIELLKKTREHILKYPETHDQGSWHCGTTMCIAGHAAILAGAELKKDARWADEIVMYVDGERVSAENFAMDQLRMTSADAGYLFYCMDNQRALERLDQVITLWEQGKTSHDLDEGEWIYDDDDL
jgi:hypothetical protein